MKNTFKDRAEEGSVHELFEALLLLKNNEECEKFFKDLCTPQEMRTLAERWRVCRLLDGGELSYRDINQVTGASLATIGRVARFLKEEPYAGYRLILNRMSKKKKT
jgi:TrpR-related protein YerC/YecD